MFEVGQQPDVERGQRDQKQSAAGIEDDRHRHAQSRDRDDVRRQRLDYQQPRQHA